MDFSLSEEQQLLKKTVREFAEAELAPHSREWDEKQEFPREVFTQARRAGPHGRGLARRSTAAPGMSTLDYAIVMEELARVDAGVALSVAAHNSLCSGHIFLAGTEEQKKKYLTPLAKGEKVGCWGLTENSAGSDAGGTKTTAVRDGDSLGAERLQDLHHQRPPRRHRGGHGGDRPARKGKKGISAFIVERGTHGLPPRQEGGQARRALLRHLRAGVRGLPHPRREPAGPGGQRLRRHPAHPRPRPHRHRRLLAGHRPGQPGGVHEVRAGPPAVRPRHRRVPGHPVQDRGHGHAGGRGAPPDLARGRACATRARSTPSQSSMAKLFASEIAVEVALEAVQIHGGYGYIKEYPVERYLRDSKLGTIGEGTSEVQRLVIARELLRPARDGAIARPAAPSDDARRAGRRACCAGDVRARRARASALVEDDAARGARAPGRALPPRRPRAGGRRHRAARGRQVDARRPPDRAPARAGQDRGHRGRRPHLALQRRRHPGRPHPHAGPRRSTRACSSARWPRAATWAAWPPPPATCSPCSPPSGKDVILVETVGVGQDEVEIVGAADVSVVVLVPGPGRRGAGAEGRHHGDRRRVRGEQGRPRGRRARGGGDRVHALAGRATTASRPRS